MTNHTGDASAVPALEATNLQKTFGAVHALRGVDLMLHGSEVTALVGDNGAGKSTLAGLIAGLYRPTAGRISVDGVPRDFASPRGAREAGIETVFQNLALIPSLDAAQNVFMCRETRRAGPLGALGFIARRQMRERLKAYLEAEGVRIPVSGVPVGSMSGGQRQIVAVTRAIFWGAKIVCLDEPTAALGVRQRDLVADYIWRLRRTGVAVLLITHNIEDVLKLADRVVVLRLGRKIVDSPIHELTHERIVLAMSGADMNPQSGAD